MKQRKPLVAANWKMNGDSALVKQISSALAELDTGAVKVAVCPPALFYSPFVALNNLLVGAQDMSKHSAGAYTGELSAQMLSEAGLDMVIIGHSERRQYHSESDQLIAEKVKAALDSGLTPIFCIGESLEVRESGQLFEFLKSQLMAVVEHCGIESFKEVVIAYEPIWAIGTGVTASKEQAQEVHAYLRSLLADMDVSVAESCSIIYGGSVNAENAAELFLQPDIDGGLVGGASLKAQSFLAICAAAAG